MTDGLQRLAAALADRYTVERQLGAGGMATVYLARDVRHDRQVALKVMRPEIASAIGPERFLREIKTTASLQHPHILPLHDSGEVDRTVFYVMPYIEGETLRDRLTRERQLPVDEAVRIAREVAGALDYAHRRGVIHRDIKPENVLLPDGQALVADFGIALAAGAISDTRMTETGLSLGTPAYMSPEQASGDRVLDPRSDIFALGCVLYEMLAGEPPFTGPSPQALMARILTGTPVSLSARRRTVPPHVDAAVTRALEKLPADRFASAAEFSAALNDPSFRISTPIATPAAVPAPARAGRRQRVLTAALAVAAMAFAGLAAWGWLRDVPAPPVARFVVSFQAEGQNVGGDTHAITPDGRTVLMRDFNGRIVRRHLDRVGVTPVPDTDNAWSIFCSPDSSQAAFTTGFPGDLKVVDLNTDSVRTIVRGEAVGSGGAWSADGWIYYLAGEGGPTLMRVRPDGGTPVRVARADPDRDELFIRWPDALPGGTAIVATIWRKQGAPDIAAIDVASGRMRVLRRGVRAFYLPTGHLAVVEGSGVVMAAPFDAARAEITGPAVEVLRGVHVGYSGIAYLAVSRTGTLVYSAFPSAARVVRVSRTGLETIVDPAWTASLGTVSLSPDGTRLAVDRTVDGRGEVWVKTLDHGPFTRVAANGTYSRRNTWSPDGHSITFISDVGGVIAAYRSPADGSGGIEPLTRMSRPVDEAVWSRDGTWLIVRAGSGGGRDIFAVKAGAETEPIPLATSDADEYSPTLSPDGRWLAYGSTTSGREEIYVRSFPDQRGGRIQISTDGGIEPVWSHSGRELFYKDGRQTLVAAALDTPGDFRVVSRRRLFPTGTYYWDNRHRSYAISRDDQSFYFVEPVATASPHEYVVVLNWLEELKRIR